MKKITIVGLVIILVLVTYRGIVLWNDAQLICSDKEEYQNVKFGIVDGGLSNAHDNICLSNTSVKFKETSTHGDEVMFFLQEYVPNVSFFYYNAEDNGKISSQDIISALEWMKNNKVDYVCISLSSNYYSNELESWIIENRDEIKIYASYNNQINTVDYPAQYSNVIGVGSDKRIEYKEKDIHYDKRKILLFSDGKISLYQGNSFLAPYSMLCSFE